MQQSKILSTRSLHAPAARALWLHSSVWSDRRCRSKRRLCTWLYNMTSDSTVCSTLQKYSAARLHTYVGLHNHCGPTFLLTSTWHDAPTPTTKWSRLSVSPEQSSRGGLAVQVSSHATVLVSDVACTNDYVDPTILNMQRRPVCSPTYTSLYTTHHHHACTVVDMEIRSHV